MRCIAVDDESPALFLMEDNIKRIPYLQFVKSCNNAYEAMEILQREKIDLVFLDIEMPEVSGLDLLQTLPSKPMVILTTAYKKYALEGYGLDVIDYLLKPIAFDRFLKAVNKAHEYYQLKNRGSKELSQQSNEYLFVHADYNLVKITLSDIAYIEALKDYIKIYLSSAPKPVITKISMKAMEEKLPSESYIRVHKSYIVSMAKVSSIRKNRIIIGNSEIPLSENYRDSFFKHVDSKNLLQ
jgi:DNA-binding LytR/AlgR family response regulator